MIEIPLMHGTIWINPTQVTSIELSSITDDTSGCYFTMRNGCGWNSPLSPKELAEKIKWAQRYTAS